MGRTSLTCTGGQPPTWTRSSKARGRGATHAVRAGHQPQNRQSNRHRHPRNRTCPRRRGDRVKRRAFITLLGGAAGWPLAARAQQGERMRRIGVLMSAVEGDPTGLEFVTAFAQGLAELGWTVGRNVRIEYRWGAGDLDRFRRYAAELIALSPDVVLATAGSIVGAFQQASRTVPIVFVTTIDPVGGGWVESLSRPGTNATGFAAYEFS